jgi:AraC family transcriptional activator of mtrCDE
LTKQSRKIIECRDYYLPNDYPLLVLSGDNWRISDIKSSRLHFHNCLEIGYCHSDTGYMDFFGETQAFEAGDITVVPRNTPHTTYSSKGLHSSWSYFFLDPRGLFGSFLPATWKYFDLLSYNFPNYQYIYKSSKYPEMKDLLSLIYKELKEEKEEYRESVRALFLSFYLLVYRELVERQRQSLAKQDVVNITQIRNNLEIAPALEYIEENYMRQFSMDDLADICHWSPTHFRRVFTEIMGMPPLDYVNHTRIMKSCHLLQNSEEAVLNISEQVGFSSVSSFNRNFRRVMTCSPTEYRQKSRNYLFRESDLIIKDFSGWLEPPENIDD